MEFETPAALTDWLNENDIDTSNWGIGGSKTAVDLWHEIQNGESTLHGRPPERVVRVVQIIIQQEGKLLKEIEQEMRDGRVRRRDLLPSDKMQPGETPEDSVYRCLLEEMGVTKDQVFSLKERERKQKKRESPSYPGIMTRYDFFILEAEIINLPVESFWRENTLANAASDPVKRHHWGWVPSDR
jgi:hypothetical protein